MQVQKKKKLVIALRQHKKIEFMSIFTLINLLKYFQCVIDLVNVDEQKADDMFQTAI